MPRIICPAEAFQLPSGQLFGIADHAPFSPAQGKAVQAALPVMSAARAATAFWALLGVEADAALAGPQGIIVPHAKTTKNLQAAVIPAHAQRDAHLAHGRAEDLKHIFVKPRSQPHWEMWTCIALRRSG